MDIFLPEGFEPARARPSKSRPARAPRLSVEVGGAMYPVTRRWATGFAVATADVPPLEGVVNLYDGREHLHQCLITAHEQRDGEQIFTVRRARDFDYASAGEGDASGYKASENP
jgi:hypothetical protein